MHPDHQVLVELDMKDPAINRLSSTELRPHLLRRKDPIEPLGERQNGLYREGEAPADPMPSSAGASALPSESNAGRFQPADRLYGQ